MSQFNFVLLDDTAANLLVDGLSGRAKILLDQSDAFCVAPKLFGRRFQRQVAKSLVLLVQLKDI